MHGNDFSEIKVQIKISIDAIRAKNRSLNDPDLNEYLKKYERALSALDSSSYDEKINSLKKLLNCARGYMEKSSNYDQEFLHEMGRTEKLVKNI